MLKSDKVTRIDGITLPPGFEELKGPLEELHKLPIETVRWYPGDKGVFEFDRNNPEYLDFLKQCRADSKTLEKVLALLSNNSAESKIWISRRSRPSSKKDWAKISVLIRPPFLHSNENKSAENRFQERPGQIVFMLHVDYNGFFYEIRHWKPRNYEEAQFKIVIAESLRENRQILSELYKRREFDQLGLHIWDKLREFSSLLPKNKSV